jgi:GGDEF domain-containing protein
VLQVPERGILYTSPARCGLGREGTFLGLGETTAWIVVGLFGWAVLLTSCALVLHRRSRGDDRPPRDFAPSASVGGASSRADETDSTRAPGPPAPDQSLPANELGLLQGLLPAVSALDLETILARGLEAASQVGNASASVIVLARSTEKPLIATLGLTSADSWRDRLGLPPESGEARAVQLAYSYPDEVSANDAFLLRSGLAVSIASEEERLGTLALYWRRVQHQVSQQELSQLETVGRAIGVALRTVLDLEDAGPFELDVVTGLPTARAMREALRRECARARRYDRRVAFILVRLELPLTDEFLSTAARILKSAVRAVDLPCYLGKGSFAVILPEATLIDAQRLHRRLDTVVAERLDGLRLPPSRAAVVELRDDEDSVSFFDRAQRALAPAGRGTKPEAEVSRELKLAST